jgi:multiple sugar transport system substrate-binding protein/putative aldouronate transport system substrate-binding protein
MKKFSVKILCCLLMICMVITAAAGCGAEKTGDQGNSGTTPSDSTSTNTGGDTKASDDQVSAVNPYEKFITIDIFDSQANYQGIASGWFAEYVKKKFNMEMNIIAPNVAGGGDTLFQTRSAAGNLGDIVMIGSENGRLEDTIKAGLIYDITDMVKASEHLNQYPRAIEMIQNLIKSDRIYAIASQASDNSPTTPSEGLDLTYGPYIRWDLYMALGAPELNTLEDLLPVLKQMQDMNPTSDSGKKVYGLSLFKDWDGNMMCLAKQPACMYGYDENGFQLLSADGKTTQSIIDDNSEYVRSLRFFFKANQMGILDPDSPTQNWDTLFAKYSDGAVLWSPWPWLGQAAYNTVERKAEGKGFMYAPVKDMKIFSYGCKPGDKYVIAVGSQAQDPQRMVDFIDWLYSPEGIMYSCAQTSGTCGPEGLTWEMQDGRPVLTEFGKRAFSGDDKLTMPDGWGSGTYKDGISQLNYQAVSTLNINPANGQPYNYTLWPSVLESNVTPLDKSWQDFMGAQTTLEYLTKNNMFVVAAGNDYIPAAAPAEIDAARNQCKQIIIAESWKMVFAKDEADFNSILKNMQETVKGLGYDEVLAFDQKISEETRAAREAALK